VSWGRTATALACISASALLSGCSLGGPDVSADASCDGPAFVSDEMPTAAPQTLILVELSRNDDEARDAVVRAIEGTVGRAVTEGGVVRLLVGGGEGEPILKSPCLDGAAAIFVDRNNDETERRARDTAVDAIERNVWELLEEKVEVAQKGNLTNLLAAVPGELSSLASAEGTEADAPATVLLVSDLNSPSPATDCLNLEGVRASQAVADGLVDRCRRSGQLRPLPDGVALEIVRPQLTPSDNAGARMSAYLRKSLCAQLSGEGGECVADSAEAG
jgi:hypothetical protein